MLIGGRKFNQTPFLDGLNALLIFYISLILQVICLPDFELTFKINRQNFRHKILKKFHLLNFYAKFTNFELPAFLIIRDT